MSSKGFVELHNAAALDEFLKDSHAAPVILFKHSNSCGISARAYREMSQLDKAVGIVTVQQARELSAEIERRFDLPHETPQVLIVRNEKAVWNASHGRVRAPDVEAALVQASGQ